MLPQICYFSSLTQQMTKGLTEAMESTSRQPNFKCHMWL
jgi:hypothetical protein